MFVKFFIIACACLIGTWVAPSHVLGANQIPKGPLDADAIGFDFNGYPTPGDIYEYKGHYIIGSSQEGVNNIPFFKMTKKAIDLTDDLPRSLQHGVRLIKHIIYDPPLPGGIMKQRANARNPNERVLHMFLGVYTLGADIKKDAPMMVYRDVSLLAPISIGYALVGNSVYARLHHNLRVLMAELKKTDRGSGKYAQLMKKIKLMKTLATASDPKVVEQYECTPMVMMYEAMLAWDEQQPVIDAMVAAMNQRECKR